MPNQTFAAARYALQNYFQRKFFQFRKYIVVADHPDFGDVFVAQGHNEQAVAGGVMPGEQALQVGLQAQQLFFVHVRRYEHGALDAATAVAGERFCGFFAQPVVFEIVTDQIMHRVSGVIVFLPSSAASA